jgi:acyl-CoA synthetase (AMP-forming)/AMP-acid ligase II
MDDGEAATPQAGDGAWLEAAPVADLLLRAAARWPDNDACVVPPRRRTFAELLAAARALARGLLAVGVEPGERVAVLLPNRLEFPEAFFACALIGAPVVAINARFRVHELRHVLADSGAVAVLTVAGIPEVVDFVALVEEAADGEASSAVRRRVLLDDQTADGWVARAELLAAGEGVSAAEVEALRTGVRRRNEALMLYTSGTTSMPKGCPLTHEALVRTATAAGERWGLTADDRFWNPLPLFHVAGLFPLLAHVHAGAAVVTMEHFEPGAALRDIAAERCTYVYPTFPPITQALLGHPDFDRTDLSHVTRVADTGSPESLRKTQARFPGAAVITMYGMTECGGSVAFGDPADDVDARMTTSGRPLRGVRVRIADPATGAAQPAGVEGEILVRGPGQFEGYHGHPEQTAAVLRDGWFHTGDLGRVDTAGRLAYLGRLKDTMKVGGENVAAAEVEHYLERHRAVNIAQVVGIPDDRLGEVPVAFVELVAGESASGDDLVAFCRGQIASFKVPRHVRVVETWPMSASKIQKFALRDALLAELAAPA